MAGSGRLVDHAFEREIKVIEEEIRLAAEAIKNGDYASANVNLADLPASFDRLHEHMQVIIQAGGFDAEQSRQLDNVQSELSHVHRDFFEGHPNPEQIAGLNNFDRIGKYITDTKQQVSDIKSNQLSADLKSKIGNYELSEEKKSRSVEEILGKKGSEILYADINAKVLLDDGNIGSPKSAREAFIDKLMQVMNDPASNYVLPDTGDDPRKTDPENAAIRLEALLGKEGVALYKAAIEEERNSKEFREAVLLSATDHYEGPKWNERMVLWVGGPSASGKSFSAKAVIDEVNKNVMENNPADTRGNTVVAIDGGVEREVSQMRQLVLQAAIQKGYPGIQDLHENTKLKMKSVIEKAAKENEDLSMVIPNTFSNPATILKVRKYDNLPNTKQVFSEIVGTKDRDNEFRETVASNGNSRAWKMDFSLPSVFKMNNRNIGCESKRYQRKYFENGKMGSEAARKIFMTTSKSKIYVAVVNDFIFVEKNTEGNWAKCEAGKAGAIKLSQRAYDAYLEGKKEKTITEELDQWINKKENVKHKFPPPIIERKQGETLYKQVKKSMSESLNVGANRRRAKSAISELSPPSEEPTVQRKTSLTEKARRRMSEVIGGGARRRTESNQAKPAEAINTEQRTTAVENESRSEATLNQAGNNPPPRPSTPPDISTVKPESQATQAATVTGNTSTESIKPEQDLAQSVIQQSVRIDREYLSKAKLNDVEVAINKLIDPLKYTQTVSMQAGQANALDRSASSPLVFKEKTPSGIDVASVIEKQNGSTMLHVCYDNTKNYTDNDYAEWAKKDVERLISHSGNRNIEIIGQLPEKYVQAVVKYCNDNQIKCTGQLPPAMLISAANVSPVPTQDPVTPTQAAVNPTQTTVTPTRTTVTPTQDSVAPILPPLPSAPVRTGPQARVSNVTNDRANERNRWSRDRSNAVSIANATPSRVQQPFLSNEERFKKQIQDLESNLKKVESRDGLGSIEQDFEKLKESINRSSLSDEKKSEISNGSMSRLSEAIGERRAKLTENQTLSM